MSVYHKIDGVDLGPTEMPFPCPRETLDKFNDFTCEAEIVTVTLIGNKSTVHNVIDEIVKSKGAKQFYCSFSRKIAPHQQLTIYYM